MKQRILIFTLAYHTHHNDATLRQGPIHSEKLVILDVGQSGPELGNACPPQNHIPGPRRPIFPQTLGEDQKE